MGAGQQVLAALTMRAVERGLLSLADPIGSVLPDLPPPAGAITIRQLADCTSGLQDFHYLGDRFDAFAGARRGADEVTALFAALPLRHPPGQRWEWNVSGFHLLGVALERRFAAPLREAARREVFEPAGVAADADLCDGSFLAPNLAAGHTATPDGFVRSAPRHPSVWAYASPAYCGTALAAARLAYALRAGHVIATASFERMLQADPHASGHAGRAFGVAVVADRIAGHRAWATHGHTMGNASALYDFPDDDLTVAVLASADSDVSGIAERIARTALRLPVEPLTAAPFPELPAGTAPATEAALAGVYELGFTRGKPQHTPYRYTVRVGSRFGRLFWQTCGELPQPLLRAPADRFCGAR